MLYCADENVIGTAFYVMGFVDGRSIWEPRMPDATNAERTAIYDAMNETLARLHRFDPNAIGLADYGKRRELHGPPGGALVQAIRRLQDHGDRRDGTADGMAAGSTCRPRARCGSCTATIASTT